MTVAELKKLVAAIPSHKDQDIVLVQKDPEGNGYHDCRYVDDDCIVVEDNGWQYEVANADATAEDMCMDEEEWTEAKEHAQSCVVIAP